MTLPGWVVAGLAAWPVVGTAVAVLIGKGIRRADDRLAQEVRVLARERAGRPRPPSTPKDSR